jgi:hypothetical protein
MMRHEAAHKGCRTVFGGWLVALAACTSPASPEILDGGGASTGVQVRFDPTFQARETYANTWLAFPFPADFRKTDAGFIRLEDFPDPDLNEFLAVYVTAAQSQLRGFGTNSPVYSSFSGALNVDALPKDPNAYTASNAPMQLVDVDPDSMDRGKRYPLRWEFRAQEGKYVADNMLAVAPYWGFPLAERRTYAFFMTRAVMDGDGKPLEAPLLLQYLLGLSVGATAVDPPVPSATLDALFALFAPLRTLLQDEGRNPSDVVAATVFTTQDVTGELGSIHQHVASELPAPVPLDGGWVSLGAGGAYHQEKSIQAWSDSSTRTTYHVYEGVFSSPNYQRGAVPYAASGGEFNFVNGTPEPTWFENLRFVLTVPADPPSMPRTCYPVVEAAHGTGGTAYSFVGDGTAGRLAARGLAGIALDQPLSDVRGNRPDLGFNPFNPSAGRTVFRQAAVDTFSLTRMLKGGLTVPGAVSATGEDLCFSSERITYFGHSQGGITGSLAAAFERGVDAWMFSGAGGGLSITIMEGNGGVDIAGLLRIALSVPDDEELTELHPLLGLAQMLAEAADPINYGNYWFSETDSADARSVMLTSGLEDIYTHARTATALALSAHLPPVLPLAVSIPELEWIPLDVAVSPVSNNTHGVTAGFLQWGLPGDDSHFLVFERPEAIHASMHFLQSAVFDAVATIERDAATTAR